MKGLVLKAKWDPKEDYSLSELEKKTRKVFTGSSVWKDPKLKVKEVPLPEVGPNDLLIEVKVCGICGSDVQLYKTDEQSYIKLPGLTRFPCIIGHEFSGVVKKVGSNITGFKRGDRVTAEENLWCGKCNRCRSGFFNECENMEGLGFTVNGACAEWVVLDAKYCWKIDDLVEKYKSEDKAFLAGAVIEPTAAAYYAIFERAEGFKPGNSVVVHGTGPIGLAAIALCKAAGAAKVICFEISKIRRELARKMGADYIFDPNEVIAHEVVMEVTKGQGANVHVEATHVSKVTFPEMERSLAVNGKVVEIGISQEKASFHPWIFQTRRAQFYGSNGYSGHAVFPNIIALMASGLIDMTKIITEEFPLDKAADALATASTCQCGKVVVRIRQ